MHFQVMKLGELVLLLLATAIFSLVGGLLLPSIVSKQILRSKNIADVSTFSKSNGPRPTSNNVVQIHTRPKLFSSIGYSSKCCCLYTRIEMFIHFKGSSESDDLRAKLKGTSLFLVGMMGSGKSTVGF